MIAPECIAVFSRQIDDLRVARYLALPKSPPSVRYRVRRPLDYPAPLGLDPGKVRGEYGKVTLIPGDPGHLTYRRSQTTLASGNLHLLIKDYCDTPGAALASRLRRYLPGLAARDTALDTNTTFRDQLERAGDNPVMCDCQDRFFDRVYWNVALQRAANVSIATALGTCVVYDSTIHGSWSIIQAHTSERPLNTCRRRRGAKERHLLVIEARAHQRRRAAWLPTV